LAGVTWASSQTPTQLLTHSPCSTGQGQKAGWKTSWVEIKTGRSLTSHCHRQNRLSSGKL